MINWEATPYTAEEKEQYEQNRKEIALDQYTLSMSKYKTNRKLYLPEVFCKVKTWNAYTEDNRRCIEFAFDDSLKRKVVKERRFQQYLVIPKNLIYFPEGTEVTIRQLSLTPLIYEII